MTARKAWEYRPQPSIFADRISNAIRLSNGDTLVNFGFRADDTSGAAVLVEAKLDGTAAWQQDLKWAGLRASRYRVYPLTTLAGEQSVEPTALPGR